MSKIEITRGLPGSGKSTYAKMWVNLLPERRVRVNRDAIRWTQGIREGVGTKAQENLVSVIEKAIVVGAIKEGKDVIIDATHLNPEFIRKWYKIAKIHGVRNVKVVDFAVPVGVAIARDLGRREQGGRYVGAAVIEKLAERAKVGPNGELPVAPKFVAVDYFDRRPIAEYDPELPDAYIVDTDGTMANHEGVRNPYDTTRYEHDTVHENVARTIWHLEMANTIIGVSGRKEAFRQVTLDWWRNNARMQPDEFYFRRNGDDRSDDVVKAEIYENHIRGRYNVIGVFDDRGRVLRMWRSKGFTTFAVGDTDNYDF
ncbi:polynucleotide kinase [Microbacterium phage Tandem]|nr:polynucleotide kinase [Microbacterium phage Pioneer3]AWY06405.1 polynucleotide kinase [Microbacterium phage Tandem]